MKSNVEEQIGKFKYKCICLWSKNDKYGFIPNTECPAHGKQAKKLIKGGIEVLKEELKYKMNLNLKDKMINYCSCGKEINEGSKRCRECFVKNKFGKLSYSKKNLKLGKKDNNITLD